jgi:hypothetical protein
MLLYRPWSCRIPFASRSSKHIKFIDKLCRFNLPNRRFVFLLYFLNTFKVEYILGEIQSHLQAMLHFIRSEDKLSMAVRLQSLSETHIRYLAVLSTFDPSETKETALMGFDILDEEKTTFFSNFLSSISNKNFRIGVTVPLTGSTRIELDGDGGITIYDPSSSVYMFRPISIKAMWSLFQFLHKVFSYVFCLNNRWEIFSGVTFVHKK